MWICSRCHTENHENQSVCESCGAARSAGRFSAPAMQGPARAPRVSPAASQPAPEMRRAAPAYQPPATDMPPARPPRRPLQFFARLVGILLCLLLPLANLLLLLSLSDLLSSIPGAASLFGDMAPGWKILAQIFIGLLSLLLSLLPGLWTLLLCEPRPPKYRRLKK